MIRDKWAGVVGIEVQRVVRDIGNKTGNEIQVLETKAPGPYPVGNSNTERGIFLFVVSSSET